MNVMQVHIRIERPQEHFLTRHNNFQQENPMGNHLTKQPKQEDKTSKKLKGFRKKVEAKQIVISEPLKDTFRVRLLSISAENEGARLIQSKRQHVQHGFQ